MERINIYSYDNYEEKTFEGWFDNSSAKEIASYRGGDTYISGKILKITTKNKFIINEWNNTDLDIYHHATDENEIAEILVASDYQGQDEELLKILNKFEF